MSEEIAAPQASPEASQPVESQAAPSLAGGQTDWRSGISDDYKNSPVIQEAKDLNSLASIAVNGQSQVGKLQSQIQELEANKGIKPITPDSTPEEKQAFYSSIGWEIPESPDGYELQRPEPSAESQVSYSEKLDNWFKEKVHKLELPKDKVQEFYSDYNKILPEIMEEHQQELYKAGEERLKSSYGEEYKEKLSNALTVLMAEVPENTRLDIAKEMDQRMLTYNPNIVASLNALYEKYYTEGGISANRGNVEGQTLKDLENDLSQFQQENKAALFDSSNVRHKEVREAWEAKVNKIAQIKIGK